MGSSSNAGLFALHLGPKSSFIGSFSSKCPFVSVDFLNQFNNSGIKSQFNKDDILWDGKVDEINTCNNDSKLKELDTYSSNPELHWSSLCDLPEKNVIKLKHCNNFSSYQNGSNLIADQNLSDEFEDKIRYQVEKSDLFRGFVNIYDSNTGFGGLLSRLYSIMDDSFGKKPKLTFGVGSTAPNLFELDNVSMNSVCSFLNWKSFKGKFRGLINEDTDYHLSAILSLYIEQTLQIPHEGTDFQDFTTFLSPLSRNIFTSFLGLPFDEPEDRSLGSLLSSKYLKSNICPVSLFSSQVSLPLQHTFVSCGGIPGIANNQQFFSSLTKISSETKVFSSATKYSYSSSANKLSSLFPQFFNDRVLSDGRLRLPQQKVRNMPVREMPVISLLQNSNDPVRLLEKVLSRRVNVTECSDLIAAGVLQDDISEIRQHLNELLENYTMS